MSGRVGRTQANILAMVIKDSDIFILMTITGLFKEAPNTHIHKYAHTSLTHIRA